jgi:hypothetical protein
VKIDSRSLLGFWYVATLWATTRLTRVPFGAPPQVRGMQTTASLQVGG